MLFKATDLSPRPGRPHPVDGKTNRKALVGHRTNLAMGECRRVLEATDVEMVREHRADGGQIRPGALEAMALGDTSSDCPISKIATAQGAREFLWCWSVFEQKGVYVLEKLFFV